MRKKKKKRRGRKKKKKKKERGIRIFQQLNFFNCVGVQNIVFYFFNHILVKKSDLS